MRKILFCILLCSSSLLAHGVTINFSLSRNFTKSFNLRLSAGFVPDVINLPAYFGFDLLSISLVQSDDENKKIYIALPISPISFQANFPIIQQKLHIFIEQNTDFFVFYEVSRIYTETNAGLEFYENKIGAFAGINIPWTKNYNNVEPRSLNFMVGLKLKL